MTFVLPSAAAPAAFRGETEGKKMTFVLLVAALQSVILILFEFFGFFHSIRT